MSSYKVAQRYAKSIIELAEDTGRMDKVVEDMQLMHGALQSRELFLFLKSPIISPGKKQSVLRTVFEGKISDLTMSFINRATAKGRERNLPEIIEAFQDLYLELQGISKVKLITARPASKELLQKITSTLQASNQTRGKVQLETAIDEDLIGGFVIDFEDRKYDASVQNALNDIKKQFSA
jgi:F-type H+-transporting ATPase subunit delta